MMKFWHRPVVALVLLTFFAGCEVPSDTESGDTSGGQDTQRSENRTPENKEDNNQAPTSTDSDEAAHGLVLSQAKVKGAFDFRNAQITVALTSCSISGQRVTLEWERHSWPMHDGRCDGVVCAVWKEGGEWVGAYIDWCPAGRDGYTWGIANVREYGGPASGEEIGFFILSDDKKQRSNVLFTTWP